jgi:hypothetical protein
MWKMACTNQRIKEGNATESETAEANKYRTVSEDGNKSTYWFVYYFNTDIHITVNHNKFLYRRYMLRSCGTSSDIKMHFYLSFYNDLF